MACPDREQAISPPLPSLATLVRLLSGPGIRNGIVALYTNQGSLGFTQRLYPPWLLSGTQRQALADVPSSWQSLCFDFSSEIHGHPLAQRNIIWPPLFISNFGGVNGYHRDLPTVDGRASKTNAMNSGVADLTLARQSVTHLEGVPRPSRATSFKDSYLSTAY